MSGSHPNWLHMPQYTNSDSFKLERLVYKNPKSRACKYLDMFETGRDFDFDFSWVAQVSWVGLARLHSNMTAFWASLFRATCRGTLFLSLYGCGTLVFGNNSVLVLISVC